MPTTEKKTAATMRALMVGATTKATKREMKPIATFKKTSTMAVIRVPTMLDDVPQSSLAELWTAGRIRRAARAPLPEYLAALMRELEDGDQTQPASISSCDALLPPGNSKFAPKVQGSTPA